MTIYAFRDTPHQCTLTEFATKAEFLAEAERVSSFGTLHRVMADRARAWVKGNGHHETALFINLDGQVRRAGAGF